MNSLPANNPRRRSPDIPRLLVRAANIAETLRTDFDRFDQAIGGVRIAHWVAILASYGIEISDDQATEIDKARSDPEQLVEVVTNILARAESGASDA